MNKAFRKFLSSTTLITVLLIISKGGSFLARSQVQEQWTTQERIPGYEETTNPPYLIADQNKTVHAFTSQWIGNGNPIKAIEYNQWTLNSGWTEPVDILLPPVKDEARILGAYLDQAGVFHVIFLAGDETGANIYYSKAPAIDASDAMAWTKPVLIGSEAFIFENGDITGDGKDKLVVVYSGILAGPGVYVVYSFDGGNTWTKPTPIYLSDDKQMSPTGIDIYFGPSGWIHAVWDVVDIGGQGRGIYYSRSKIDSTEWSKPLALENSGIGLGTKDPRVIEHLGNVIVMYYNNGPLIYRQSTDQGQTWKTPAIPFPHVGFNGGVSFAVDSNNILHLFWGQRITGSHEIHGMWHSIWERDRWSYPEAVVSGPRIEDKAGNNSFDPTAPQAIASQGNILLVTWRSDYGLKPNGVWYSLKKLDSQELPVVPLPTLHSTPPSPPAVVDASINISPTPLITPVLPITSEGLNTPSENSLLPLILGITSAFLLVIGFVGYQINRRFNKN